ncbi:hypothetical protein MKZ38_009847 [Zalerion maritima]|uniref:FAD-binding PCMH-type domain-containing protein n=1 Tax=Zalerion maritima TaxID=339359 RepID=A0AAD5RG70_9PEZI|nr:hypothetical protein MKZ38_009847 [Zalerion maritima]
MFHRAATPALLAGLLLAAGSSVAASSQASLTSSGIKGCDALIAAGLESQLIFPTDATTYEDRVSSWWSASSRLRPWCIVQPRNTDEVSSAVKALSEAGAGSFAVRSGGHSHWAGGSNIQNGVTIDLGLMNATTYDPATGVVSLQPAPRWGDVFETLEGYGVAVSGGRDANVGVGGFLVGGGNSYYSGRHGFGCDGVVNAEVVLADGSVVSANSSTNRKLWKALKGGIGNFGIVTRFDMQAFPAGPLWGGSRASAKSYTSEVAQAVVNFTDGYENNPEAAFLINFTYQPTISSEVVIAQVLVDTDGVENPPAFAEIQEIPELFNDIKVRTMSGIASDYVLPSGYYNAWFTLTMKNDVRVVEKAAELNEQLVSDLLEVMSSDDLVTQCLFQPLPKFFADIGVEKGGNVLGMDEVEGNSLLWLLTITGTTPEHEAVIHTKGAAMKAALDEYAESIDAKVPLLYVNYADPSQDPLKSYGTRNLRFMEKVAAKYDPDGLFQRRVPGSFRLSRVE